MNRRDVRTARLLLDQVWEQDRDLLTPIGRERLAAAMRLVAEHDGPTLPPPVDDPGEWVAPPTNPRGIPLGRGLITFPPGTAREDVAAFRESLAQQFLEGKGFRMQVPPDVVVRRRGPIGRWWWRRTHRGGGRA